MVCLKRSISNDLIVYIDAEFCTNNSRIFDCIFSTFNIVDCEIIFDGSMYIYPIERCFSDERLTQ
jgi:hypothetical protein